jgi:membrane associated rhomboid family serine protease
MSTHSSREVERSGFVGNDRVLFGIIFGVLAFWLFAQTTLNISPAMAKDLGIGINLMNIAVSITALFSGIFIVVVGSLADRFGRVKRVQIGFVLGIAGSLLVGLERHVLLHRQRRYADGPSRAVHVESGHPPKGAAYWVALTEGCLRAP